MLDDDEGYTAPAGEPDVAGEPLDGHAEPAPIEKFRRSSVGAVFAAGLLGLRDVIEPPKDNTPAIVEDWAGGEPHKDPFIVRLDPDNPADSIIMVKRRPEPPSETTD